MARPSPTPSPAGDQSPDGQPCPKCPERPHNLRYHQRLVHQQSVLVKFPDGSEETLVRVNGVFHCRCGQYEHRDPTEMQNHARSRCAEPTPDLSSQDPIASPTSSPQPSPVEDGQPAVILPLPQGLSVHPTSEFTAVQDFDEYDASLTRASRNPTSSPSTLYFHFKRSHWWSTLSWGLWSASTAARVCRVGKQAYEHVRSHGAVAEPSLDLGSDIADEFEIKAIRALPHPTGRRPPFFGFKILQQPQLFCTRCHHGFSNSNSLRKHQGQDCPRRDGEEDTYFVSHAQTFGFTSATFPVDPTLLPAASNGDIFGIYKASLPPPVDYANQPVVPPLHEQDLDSFYQRNGWHRRVEGRTPASLCRLTELTKVDRLEEVLRVELTDYRIGQTTERDTDNEFRALLKEHSRGEYTTEMLRVLMALMREAVEPTETPSRLGQRPNRSKEQEQLRDELHATLFSIFTQILNHGNEDPLLMPVLSYLVARSMGPSQWNRANDISPIVAKLMYAVRTVVAHEMELVMVQDKLSTYDAYEQHKQYLVEGHDSVMTFLYYNARLIKSIRSEEYGEAVSRINDLDGMELQFHDRVIHIEDFGRMHRGLHDDLAALIQEQLFFGEEIPSWFSEDIDIAAIKDDTHNNQAGYSFLNHPDNKFDRKAQLYPRWLLSDPQRAARFANVVDGRLLWKTAPIIDVGPSVRAEEMSRDLLSNLSGSTMRNLQIICKLLACVGTQDKTSHRILRRLFTPGTPSHRTAQMLVKLLIFFRQFEIDLIRYFRGDKEVDWYQMFLWPAICHNFTGEEISERLSDETEKYDLGRLQILDYRHVATAFMRFHTQGDNAFPAEDQAFDLLGNHSTNTSERIYGVDLATLAYAKPSKIHQIIRSTILWQKKSGIDMGQPVLTLRLGPQLPTDMLLPELAAKLRRPQQPADPSAPVSMDAIMALLDARLKQPLPAAPAPHIDAAALEKAMTPIVAGLVRRLAPHVQPPPTQNQLPCATNVLPDPMFLRDFRVFIDKPDANWRTPKQAELLVKMYEGTDHILGILGPDSGKTTLILFLVKMYQPAGAISVVILPLSGLQRNFMERTAAAGISAHLWTPDSGLESYDHIQLLVVSVEHAFFDAFQELVSGFANLSRLARIIADEAHLWITAQHYREVMRKLPMFLLFAVQFVCLTATMPDYLVLAFKEITRIADFYIIRAPTHRANVRYTVSLLPKNELDDALVSYVKNRIKQYRNGELMMVFCRTKKDAKRIAKRLDVRAYTSELEPKERDETYTAWKTKGVIVNSPILGAGVDENVSDVVHYDVAWNVLDQFQEDNRVGRNGKDGDCLYFVDQERREERYDPQQPFGQELLVAWAKNTDACRRLMYSQFLDSVPVTCTSLANALPCDNCADKLADPTHVAPVTPVPAEAWRREPVPLSALKRPPPYEEKDPEEKRSPLRVINDDEPEYFGYESYISARRVPPPISAPDPTPPERSRQPIPPPPPVVQQPPPQPPPVVYQQPPPQPPPVVQYEPARPQYAPVHQRTSAPPVVSYQSYLPPSNNSASSWITQQPPLHASSSASSWAATSSRPTSYSSASISSRSVATSSWPAQHIPPSRPQSLPPSNLGISGQMDAQNQMQQVQDAKRMYTMCTQAVRQLNTGCAYCFALFRDDWNEHSLTSCRHFAAVEVEFQKQRQGVDEDSRCRECYRPQGRGANNLPNKHEWKDRGAPCAYGPALLVAAWTVVALNHPEPVYNLVHNLMPLHVLQLPPQRRWLWAQEWFSEYDSLRNYHKVFMNLASARNLVS
ncbi:C2H2-type domain-containing protein [Mycena chlorophos]|uniref:DNA 3'-5' helicase n=1 Tax=Mycena chlorophos TaxID=658473 RepID=A0A8H6SA97_MYCCL|nr:C2H2-type domain-containing protein [Mycena chlorophos]